MYSIEEQLKKRKFVSYPENGTNYNVVQTYNMLKNEKITSTHFENYKIDLSKIKSEEINGSFIYKGNNINVLMNLPDNSIDSCVTDGPYGINVSEWDKEVPSVDFWKEVYRVLKPGAHVLSFGATRTYHKMVSNLEKGGFEIRDAITWLYGGGYTKNHNVGKIISDEYRIDEWNGWGTGLKPSVEIIVMARKPLSEKTISDNVLRWRTGAINIDVSRLKYEETKNPATNPLYRQEKGYKMPEKGKMSTGLYQYKSSKNEINPLGRHPSNLILDDLSAELLDYQVAELKNIPFEKIDRNKMPSRFFYCPQIKGTENIHITKKPTDLIKYLLKMVTPPNGTTLDPFFGGGSLGEAAIDCGFKFIGIENDENYFNYAVERCKKFFQMKTKDAA